MIICSFEIDGYVQPKQRTFGNRFITPPETRAFEKLVRTLAKSAMRGNPPVSLFVVLRIQIGVSVPKSYTKKKLQAIRDGRLFPTMCDLDNQIKAISDAMNDVVYIDDRFVCGIVANRYYANKDCAFVSVETVENNKSA